MFEKIKFWLNAARVYSSPITILNWFVIFVYSLKNGGNIFAGFLALFGICLVHLATNLIDDYFDYKVLSKDEKFLSSAQNCKCLYLKNGEATVAELRIVICLFLGIAACIGGILMLMSGWYVILLAFIGLFIALTYQKFSVNALGEIAIIIAYGPLLYEGVYYVMTGEFSSIVFALSIACAFFTNTILYAHMLMDFDGDECSHKKTLCRLLKTKKNALNFILTFYFVGYMGVLFLVKITHNYFYLLTFLTLPLIIDLYVLLDKFNKDKTDLPIARIWRKPLDNWEQVSKTEDAPFYFRFFYSRNIVTWFMLLICLALVL